MQNRPCFPEKLQLSLSVVTPVYQNEEHIEGFIRSLRIDVLAFFRKSELIVVEDGSTDRTKEILKRLNLEIPFRLISRSEKRGYARAMKEGLELAENELIFFTDSDAEQNPEDFWKLYGTIDSSDMVIGYKAGRRPFYRKIASRINNLILNLLFGTKFRDMNCGFRLIRKEILDEILGEIKALPVAPSAELTIRASKSGFRIREIAVRHNYRKSVVFSLIRMPGLILRHIRDIRKFRSELSRTYGRGLRAAHIMKSFRAVWQIRFLRNPVPLALWVDLTTRCQGRCFTCGIPEGKPADMPVSQAGRLIRESFRLGCARIQFTGGDPLLHPEADSIVTKAKLRGLHVTMAVRETHVRRHLNTLKKADLVLLAFDGRKEHHDAQKGAGSFDSLMEAFRLFKARGIRFQTTTCLTKINLSSLPFIIQTAREHGFKTTFQTLYYPLGGKGSDEKKNGRHPLKEYLLSPGEHRSAGKYLLELKKKTRVIASSRGYIQRVFLDWPDQSRMFLDTASDESLKCWAGRLFCNVNAEGVVMPCGEYRDYSRPEDFLSFFHAGFARAFRAAGEGRCRACLKSCFVEINSVFSLKTDALWNWLNLLG